MYRNGFIIELIIKIIITLYRISSIVKIDICINVFVIEMTTLICVYIIKWFKIILFAYFGKKIFCFIGNRQGHIEIVIT